MSQAQVNSFIPFALPEIGEAEINEVAEALRSGWVTTGPKTKQFESDFAAFLGGNVEAIAVNSATAGLHLAVEACGIGPGDEVIVPVHTFTATAEVVRYVGADVVFVDVDPHTYNMTAQTIEAAITPRTKAVMPVHYAGLACEVDEIIAVARKHNLKVIEDAAHSFPTLYQNKLIGTLDTDATIFSFYANKTMTTGEGGMLVTKNPELAKRAKVMRLHGMSRDAFDRFTSTKPAWYYEIVAPGFKYNLTDIASAIGIHQLKRAREFAVKREAIAARYQAAFANLPVQVPKLPRAGSSHSWHLYVLQILPNAKLNRDEFIAAMFKAGIGCSVHYVPLHLQPYWRERYALTPEQFPNAHTIYQGAVSLPIYSKMSEQQIQYVIQTVTGLLSGT